MPHTLVTGANSFVAAFIIQSLISEGHQVIGTVRRLKSGDEILKEHPEWSGSIDFVEINDYTNQDNWDALFKSRDIDYIVHVASPIFSNPETIDYDRDYLKPGVDG